MTIDCLCLGGREGGGYVDDYSDNKSYMLPQPGVKDAIGNNVGTRCFTWP